ncbi:Manganese/iron superoxide dismutase-like protein [Paenibacillus curdlanolyticus YK9]|uniref:superoxide dismutase n=1 Tax=Paenibacillus curdlanolyticus YK9 TaxID=717606 RepID=E0IAY6_9BACL|nr:Fe-Mn family superoxide dismutase [Paenibacillus curdlanolyticus]EFM10277.1 Manganese/iron superoxide dismutase-like protein [Paenibacillus curdlanolyticus YK9]
MLFVYGPQTPIRLLEEIRDWKRQEIEHAAMIRRFTPTLEPEFKWLLNEWEQPLRAAERVADRCLNEALTRSDNAGDGSSSAMTQAQADLLLQASAYQSQKLVEHLLHLMERSASLASAPAARSFILHAVRESNGFLGLQETYRYSYSPEQALAQSAEALRNADRSSHAGTQDIANAGDDPQGGSDADADRAPVAQVPIGGHRLPPLPYPYNALEPYIDEKTMRIHHDKHHQSYVDGLNKAERELEEARRSGNFDLVKHWERELAFNGAGHYLHTLFWNVMAPHAGGPAIGPLGAQIKHDFGSFEAFKKQFSEAAAKVEGSGWAILVWSPRSRRLEILTAEKHQNLSQWDVVPILLLDVWEHAYYLKHQNNRADYIKDWWNVVNWPYANERFEKASKLVWEPF